VVALFLLLAPQLFYRPATDKWQVSGQTILLEVATTAAAQQQGLSGRNSLASDSGMLFVFNKTASECFWMKDMRFSLDMVFINETKQIVKVQRGVTPQTYPAQFCASNVRYVIEINAGQAAKLGLHTGQTLHF
jgi:hypothetical protein